MIPIRRRPTAVFVLLVAAATSACFERGDAKKDEAPSADAQTAIVRPATLARRALDRRLEVSGEVEALTRSEVSSRLPGLALTGLHADLGDAVDAGAPLCTLDDVDARRETDDARLAEGEAAVRVKEAEASLDELRAQARGHESTVEQAIKAFERAKAQAERGALAAEALENQQYKLEQERSMKERLALQTRKAEIALELARHAVDKAKAAARKAEQNLAWTVVRAPFRGVVAKRTARLGQIVQAGAPLFEIFDPSSLAVAVQVTQRDLPYVRPGQRVELATDAFPDRPFVGAVAVVSPVVDDAAGTVPVRIAVEGADRLKPGLFISGRIVLERREGALVVPKKAVLYERERPYVFRIDAEADALRVRRVFFREGLSDKEDVEALAGESGLEEGRRVVLVGQDRLRDGDAVALEAAPAAASRPTAETAPGARSTAESRPGGG